MADKAHNSPQTIAGAISRAVVPPILFVAGFMLGCERSPLVVNEDYSSPNCVNAGLAKRIEARGLHLVSPGKDDPLSATEVGKLPCHSLTVKPGKVAYIGFRVDPVFKRRGLTNVAVTIDYFDDTFGNFGIEYDGFDAQAPDRSEKGELRFVVYHHGEYTQAPETVTLECSRGWRTATLHLRDVRFQNSQDGNADFRLKISGRRFFLRRVTLCAE
jgi:hypothetical protein